MGLNPTDGPLLLRGPLDLCITTTGVCPRAPPEKPNQSDLQGQGHAWVTWQAFSPWATSLGARHGLGTPPGLDGVETGSLLMKSAPSSLDAQLKAMFFHALTFRWTNSASGMWVAPSHLTEGPLNILWNRKAQMRICTRCVTHWGCGAAC